MPSAKRIGQAIYFLAIGLSYVRASRAGSEYAWTDAVLVATGDCCMPPCPPPGSRWAVLPLPGGDAIDLSGITRVIEREGSSATLQRLFWQEYGAEIMSTDEGVVIEISDHYSDEIDYLRNL